MVQISTLLSDELRLKHAKNQELGCGNFLHVACEVSPHAAQPHLWTDRPCRIFTGESYTSFSLLELRHVVDTYASWYYGIGVRAKDPVGVYVSEGMENIVHYLALNAIGAIPTIVNGNMPAETAAKWFEKVGAVGLFSDASHAARIAPFLRENAALRFFVTDESAAQVFKPELPEVYPFRHAEKDPVLVGHSSGTTGIPKAVQFQHQQFFYGIRYRLGLPFPQGSERILSALPHSHSAGIAYLMLAVLSGCSTLVLSSNKPEVVLPAIDDFRPTMVVAFPETYVLLSESDLEAHDLGSIRLWFNGGDAAHEAHIRRLISKGHRVVEGKTVPGSVFIDGLGSSEMGFSLFRNVHTPDTSNYDRCIGTPLEWVDAAVLDDNGVVLPPGRIGRLGVKSPSITPGYWNDSVLTARSQLSGYFLTGDLFYRDERNRFFHVDRVPDAIRTEDGMVYSLLTEEILLKHFPEITDCTVVGSPGARGLQEATIIVRLKDGAEKDADQLLRRMNEKLACEGRPGLSAVAFADLADIPLGPTGKVLKREVRELLRSRPARQKPLALEPLHA
jgi:acyl-coenzyme A synthetase/AMP-(fatty) acid ligase